jgi:hypothetical protein
MSDTFAMATPRVSFRSPSPEHQRLLCAAQSLGTTTSNLCRLAIRDLLNGLEKKKLISPPFSASPDDRFAYPLRKEAP